MAKRAPLSIIAHRAHDYRFLLQRWRRVARAGGLSLRPFSSAVDYPIYVLKSPRLSTAGGIYISAGIHGDEPAGTEALITWAEQNPLVLSELPCLIFPCLNPWGLVNNSRLDQDHRDLNRVFQHDEAGVVQALKQLIRPHRFSVALTLHEDYDGRGLYIYEIDRVKPYWGEHLLNIAAPFIPIEGRSSIDGRRATGGIVRRKIKDLQKFPMVPEALYLHMHHAERTFTFETPSEFALDQRVQVQIKLIEESIRLARQS